MQIYNPLFSLFPHHPSFFPFPNYNDLFWCFLCPIIYQQTKNNKFESCIFSLHLVFASVINHIPQALFVWLFSRILLCHRLFLLRRKATVSFFFKACKCIITKQTTESLILNHFLFKLTFKFRVCCHTQTQHSSIHTTSTHSAYYYQ